MQQAVAATAFNNSSNSSIIGARIRTKKKHGVCMSAGHDGIIRSTLHEPDVRKI